MARSFYTAATDHALLNGSNQFATGVANDPIILGLTVLQSDDFKAVNDTWNAAYSVAVDTSTRTKGTIIAKDAARKAMILMAADLVMLIKGNPAVTDQQKADLGVGYYEKGAHHGVETQPPMVAVAMIAGHIVELRITDLLSPGRRAKPAGVTGAVVFSFSGSVPPPNLQDWRYEGMARRSDYRITFSNDIPAGGQVWVTALWENAAGQGPACDPVGLTLGGGMVQLAA